MRAITSNNKRDAPPAIYSLLTRPWGLHEHTYTNTTFVASIEFLKTFAPALIGACPSDIYYILLRYEQFMTQRELEITIYVMRMLQNEGIGMGPPHSGEVELRV